MQLVLAQQLTAGASPWNVPAQIYDMVVDGRKVGHISLRFGHDETITRYAGQVGYAVEEAHRGRGYAAAALALLAPIARRQGFEALWITCAPDNPASVRTLEKAGATYVETVGLPTSYVTYARGERQKMRFRLDLY